MPLFYVAPAVAMEEALMQFNIPTKWKENSDFLKEIDFATEVWYHTLTPQI